MKRLFILASAAIVALASCSKTQVVYNDAPEEIGFKTVTGAMTKVADGTQMPETMGVIAYKGNEQYFPNTSYSNKTTYWGATSNEEKRYWPVDGDLTFTVYAPFSSTAMDYDNAEKTLEFTADNSTVGSQIDWLYGENQPTGNKEAYGATNMPVQLNHALTQIVINFSANAADLVTLTSVSLNNTNQIGTGTITYPDATPSWTQTDNGSDMQLLALNSSVALTTSPTEYVCLVIPTTALDTEEIHFTYKLAGSNVDLPYTITNTQLGNTWTYGKRYIYNVSIGAAEIMIDPTVTAWDANTDGNAGDDHKDINI